MGQLKYPVRIMNFHDTLASMPNLSEANKALAQVKMFTRQPGVMVDLSRELPWAIEWSDGATQRFTDGAWREYWAKVWDRGAQPAPDQFDGDFQVDFYASGQVARGNPTSPPWGGPWPTYGEALDGGRRMLVAKVWRSFQVEKVYRLPGTAAPEPK